MLGVRKHGLWNLSELCDLMQQVSSPFPALCEGQSEKAAALADVSTGVPPPSHFRTLFTGHLFTEAYPEPPY